MNNVKIIIYSVGICILFYISDCKTLSRRSLPSDYENSEEETGDHEFSPPSITTDQDKRWKRGMIYYIDSRFSLRDKQKINRAINELNVWLCKKMRAWRSGDKDYAYIVKGPKHGACSSRIGKIGGKQKVQLGEGCMSKTTIQHELMHALGFGHEQSRPDRDSYVNILNQNIKAPHSHNFDKKDLHTHIPYDYKSIMHYGAYDFTKGNKKTIKTKNGAQIGYEKELSYWDKVKLHALYCSNSKYHKPLWI